MLLKGKNAVIYGGGGAVGGAVARAFARHGARLFLTGRNLRSVDKVATAIAAEGGLAETAQVDVLDEQDGTRLGRNGGAVPQPIRGIRGTRHPARFVCARPGCRRHER